ncbi:MAG: aminopeptidase N C-terminal domain-containing protein, partial [Pseudolabrys sp.]|nr:aminopeptidase N C-terminal domain-containing protein [Pseudolabrys sp.]
LQPASERAAVLADFYARFEADPLVIDKWFALQAMIPEAATLDKVRALAAHPAFSMTNPNRMRSLIGSFLANATQFNRKDGAGYRFAAETIVALDPVNPQVAARLATAFRTWRSMEAERRAQAEAALKQIEAKPGLSRDVSDIVERALEPSAS